MTLVSRERVQQRTSEQSEEFPQLPEVVEAVTLVPRERVQQRIAEKIGDVPQFRKEPEETVDAVILVPRERVQQWTADASTSRRNRRDGDFGPA